MMPEKIDRYEIKGEIGRGGMATVFEAYDPRFERTVAVKVLPREFMHDPEFRTRFTREAKVIASLEHPAIVPVYDFGEHDGQPFIIMRIMRGGSLLDRLQNGPLPIDEAAEILKRLGSALDRAHSQGIVHRDLKPSNVLFDEYGDAYLADFGIVRVSSSSNALTASGSLIGTPTYMSPEQVYGDKELDGRSDIYALGVILFQMLTGTVPYEADTPARMMMKHLMDPVPHIKQVRPDLPDDFEDVILKAMAKERQERYPSAKEFSSALTAITQKTKRDEIAAELHSMQANLQASSTDAPAQEETATPLTSFSEPVPEAETTDQMETAVPTTPPAQESTFAEASPEVEPDKSKRVKIPLWVWAAITLLVVVCIVGIIGTISFINQGGFASLAAATATPVAARLQETPTDEPTTEPTTQPTDEPTDTPTTEPATATPPAETAVSDPDGTRTSLEATRAALTGASATNTPDANLSDLEATRAALEELRGASAVETAVAPQFAPLVGPLEGILLHTEESTIQSEYAIVDMQNFYLEATFDNPFAADVGGWDFGITFRQVDLNNELRLVIRSDGSWNLNQRLGDEDNFIHEARMRNLLDVAENGRNRLQLIALDETGYFFINGEFIDILDLSAHLESGDIAVGTGFYTSDVQPGSATEYSGYSVWEIDAAHGPESGALEHIDNDFIKTSYANTETADFIAHAVFTNPYDDTDEFGWDYGFVFRDVDTNNSYWFVVTSSERWELVDRREEEDMTVDDDFLNNLNLGAGAANDLLLIAQNETGYFFINGDFINTLDLSDRFDSGEIGVFTAYFIGNEQEGNSTGFDDFTVWPLP